jgi:AcrR family transcriptional regulator
MMATAPARSDGELGRRADVRRRVLEAARGCFVRDGVGRTRMADVAEAAGVSRPLLYQYYADRPALIEALINDELADLCAELKRRIPKGASFDDTVVRLSVASIQVGRQDSLLADLFAHSPYGDLTALLLQPGRPPHSMVLDVWRPVFERGRARGELRADLSDADLIEWIMMCHHLFYIRADMPLDRVADMLETFVLPGLRPDAPVRTRPMVPRSEVPEMPPVQRQRRARRPSGSA